MNKKLYKLMNWADIEEIIYSECDHPQDLLGPHATNGGTLIQAYFPGAKAVSVKWLSADPLVGDQVTQMEVADEDGYFAVILPEKKIFNYSYNVTHETVSGKKTIKKESVEMGDPYRHAQIIKKADIDSFCNGEMLDAYSRFGAKLMSHSGEKGGLFSVWAPNALRVSVVGDFNSWDGRIHQMKRIEGGFFELFIPGELEGSKYQFEIKLKGDIILKRNDPYSTVLKDGVSVVNSANSYKWSDDAYIKANKCKPDNILVYEISDNHFTEDLTNFEKDAAKLIKHIKMQGYNYVQINPQNYDDAEKTCISYIYSINKNATCDTLKKFIDLCHKSELGVIVNWNSSGFGRAMGSMEKFDGTALFEHQNPLQGISYDGANMLYQYGRGEVISFLLSNGMYWLKEFHADGICMSNIAKMLYLDYGKCNGQWVPNIYGDNENIEAVAFIKNFIDKVNNECKRVIVIAEDSSAHAGMTASQKDGGLGFDYKWNEGYINDFYEYLSYDPINRKNLHNKLVDEFVYSYAEKFVLPMSDKINLGYDSLMNRLPGDENMKKSAIRLAIAYEYMHPGNKLVSEDIDASSKKLCAELNRLLIHEPAIGKNDNNSDSFEWLSNMKADGCYISYVRKTDDPEEMMIAIFNFAGISQTVTTGVPYEGKYEELINTDDKVFGGTGIVNNEILRAEAVSADGRPQSISVKLGAQSMTIMKFIPYTEQELAKVIEERIRNYTPVKRTKKNGK